MEYWTQEEVVKLEKNYPNTTNESVARIVGKSPKAIISKAQRLGLKKNWRYKQKVLKEAVKR